MKIVAITTSTPLKQSINIEQFFRKLADQIFKPNPKAIQSGLQKPYRPYPRNVEIQANAVDGAVNQETIDRELVAIQSQLLNGR